MWGVAFQEFPNAGDAHHLVHHRPVPNVFGPCSVYQRVGRLINALLRRCDGGNDAGFRVPSQRILQEPRQLAFSVWNVRLHVHTSQSLL